MPVTDAGTYGRTRLSFASEADIEEFVATLGKFERGEITPDQWRAFRLVRGTYGQRQDADAQMLTELTLSYTFYKQPDPTADELQSVRNLKSGSEATDADLNKTNAANFANDAPKR